jgi:Flp pilus assembly protein TadG
MGFNSVQFRVLCRRAGQRSRGQTLVEFALVFPLFFTLILGLIEFTMLFNATLSINYASRDGALSGAEAGDQAGADCVILKSVENAVGAPADRGRISQVQIYKSTPNGVQIGAATIYSRSGVPNPVPCAGIDGSSIPYSQTANGYNETDRCSVLAGCGGTSTTVDNISVRVFYTHVWVTPLRNFIGGGPGGISFERSSVMRMEPIL